MAKNKVTINYLYQSLYQVLVMILPIITSPYLARVLGAENTGVYSYTHTAAHYFVIFAALGIEAYGNRTIAKIKTENQDKINYTFSSIFYVHALTSIIALAAYFLYIFLFMKEYRLIACIQSVYVVSALFDVNWFFFGMEKFKLTVTRNMLIKVGTVVLMFCFVRTRDDLWKYALIMSLGTFLSQSVVWIFIPKYVKFVRVKISDIFLHLKPLFIIFIAVIATSIYRMMDKLMLGWNGNMNSLGAYEYADRLIRLVVALITALGTVMLPKMSLLYAQGKESIARKYLNSSTQFMFTMSFALAFGVAGIANEFIIIFLGEEYVETIYLICILAVSLPFMGWNNLIRTQILMPKEKDTIYMRAVWAGAIANIVLNFILIYLLGSVGAAIATVIAYIVVCIFQTIPVWKEFDVKDSLKHLFFPFFSGLVMLFAVRVIGNAGGASIGTVVLQIIVGAGVYCLCNGLYLYKMKNEVAINFINRLRKK